MKKLIRLFFVLICTVYVCFNAISVEAASFNIDFNPSSESLLLLNLDVDVPVYEKNVNQRRSPASTTKIMTYIVTIENVKDLENTKITISDEVINMVLGTDSSIAGLEVGDTVTVYQLLHCLMIPSGNDAALALADYVGEHDISKFVDMMNQKAKELGCNDTHFVNPHGLYDEQHYTTASDMAKMAKYALSLPYFSEITNEVVSYVMGDDWPLITTNSMIDPYNGGTYYYKYAKGIKTGHENNGFCLVSTATKGGNTYLCVALGAPDTDPNKNGAMIDSKSLYMWAFDNLEIKTVLDEQQPIGEVNVEYAFNKDKLLVLPAKDFSTVLPYNVEASSIDIVVNYPDTVTAPIKEGDKIGTATLCYANQPLQTIDVVASETVNRSQLLYGFAIVKNIVTSKAFVISSICVIILLAIYLVITMLYNKRNKKNKRKNIRKYRRY